MEKEVLLQFAPLFCDSFTAKEINTFAGQLAKAELLKKDDVSKIKENNKLVDKIGHLLKSTWSNEASWFGSFQAVLKITFGKTDISEILFAAYLKNENVLWLLDVYNNIDAHEKSIRDSTWMLSKNQLPVKKWKLRLLSFVATSALTISSNFVEMLEEKMKQSLTDVSLSSFNDSSTSLFSGDVERVLQPLVPMLNECLDVWQFKSLCADLKTKGHLSSAQSRNLRNKTDTKGVSFEKLVHSLKWNAKDSWKMDFVKILGKHCTDKLVRVVRRHMYDGDSGIELLNLRKNWDLFKQYENAFKKAVHKTAHTKLTAPFPDFILEGVLTLTTCVANASKFSTDFLCIVTGEQEAFSLSETSKHDLDIKRSLEAHLPSSDSDGENSLHASSFNFEDGDMHSEIGMNQQIGMNKLNQNQPTPSENSNQTLQTDPKTPAAIKKEKLGDHQLNQTKTSTSRNAQKRKSDNKKKDNETSSDGEFKHGQETDAGVEHMEVDDHTETPHHETYASKVAGTVSKKEKSPLAPAVLSVREQTKILGFNHYFNAKHHSEKHKYVLEFHAMAVNGIKENDMLCVYFKHDDTTNPMHYNEVQKCYSFIAEVDRTSITYKYAVQRAESNAFFWEFLPALYENNQIRNREVVFKKDGYEQRHMITFDIVNFFRMELHQYENLWSEYLWHMWPSFRIVAVHSEEKNKENLPLFVFVKLFSDWFASFQNGVRILTDHTLHYDYVHPNFHFMKESDFLANETKSLMEDSASFSKEKRVLGTLGVVIAMKLNSRPFDRVPLKMNILNGLSLHDVNVGQVNEIYAQLIQCYERISKGNSTFKPKIKEVLNDVFFDLATEPECLLFLPIYTVAMNAASNEQPLASLKIPPTKKLSALKEHFRQNLYQRSIKEMADKVAMLSPVFPKMREIYQDILSPQSVCDLVTNDHATSQLFNAVGIFKKLNFFWKKMLSYYQTSKEEIVSVHCNLILHYLETFVGSDPQEEEQLIFCKELLSSAERSVKLIQKSHHRYYVSSLCIARALNVVSHVLNCATRFDETVKQIDELQKLSLNALSELISHPKDQNFSSKDIELWNTLTEVTWNKTFEDTWKSTAMEAISLAIPKRFSNNPQKLLEFYANEFEQMRGNEHVKACFGDVIVSQVEKSLQGNTGLFDWIRQKISKPQIVNVCVDIFLKYWNHFQENKEIDGDVLIFMQQWQPASAFYKLLTTKELKSHLSSECKTSVKTIKASVIQLLGCLQTGEISLLTLKQILKVESHFLTCLDCCTKKTSSVDPQPTTTEVKNLLQHRLSQMEFFINTRKAVDTFLTEMKTLFQGKIFNDIDSVSHLLEQDTSKLLLCHVINCKHIRAKDMLPTKPGTLSFFPFGEDVLQEIKNLLSSKALSNNHVKKMFKQKWFEECEKANVPEGETHQVSVVEFLIDVWTPVRLQIQDTVQKIDDGSILGSEVDDLFGKLKNNNEVETNLKILYKVRSLSQEKSDFKKLRGVGHSTYLVDSYLKLCQNQQQAASINTLREELKLEGEFSNLEKSMVLANQMDEKPLNSITKEITLTVKELQAVAKHEQVITACVKHINLIKWLKENMKNINEVKVMSDLAMISAGETSVEVDRVTWFLSAVIGFSPLIFDLPKTAGWKEFVQACEEVGKNTKRDGKLLHKWKETSKRLDWLKTTKDLHGSVEKSSLERARLINMCGNYIVGEDKMLVPTVKDCLQMKISKYQAKQSKMKISEDISMGIGDLRDLQSRLMLIAGEAEKGKHDVDRYIAVLSVIEKLTKAYVKLRNSGCLLFSNWKAIIRCNDDDGGMTVSVFFDEKSPAITSREKVIGEVHKLTTVLEDANKTWLAYLGEKRTNHYHLNHFNIHQLTYLCKSLANAEELEDFPDQVYCLLASVMPTASYEDIIDTLDDATRIKDDVEMEEVAVEEEMETDTTMERKTKIVRQLVQGELSESVAKAAVQAVKSLDLDDCYLWALENEFDEPKVEKLQKEFEEEMGFKENWSKIGVVKDVLKDHTNLSLKQVIEHIQENLEISDKNDIGMFVNTTCERYLKGTSVTSLSDCVSLEHIGIFLSQLSAFNRGPALPRREWADQFESGKPNLVVCTPDSVWRNVLSIYAKSPEQPLPSASEVLVCSETTTAEEVDLLLRRAISKNPDDGKRIYCLACAEQLSFTTAKEVEQCFQHLTQSKDKNDSYRLVVVSSNSQHYMTTCFDEHQVAKGHLAEEADLKLYIKRHLRVDESCDESVAMVDKERSSVRLVYSENAGNGKSLYIQRCRESVQETFEDRVFFHDTVLRFLDKTIDLHDITDSLYSNDTSNSEPHFVHVDVTPAVGTDANKFLFDLLFVGSIQNSHGVMWRRHPKHFYAIEYTQPQTEGIPSFMNILELIPSLTCISPRAVTQALRGELMDEDTQHVLMDNSKFNSEVYQRPYQYLNRYKNREVLDGFSYSKPDGTPLECLTTLLQFCSIAEPSWAELHHFSSFLNVQLQDCENSIFCNVELVGIESQLIGFKSFVVRFMIRMSQDFATSSLGGTEGAQVGEEAGGLFELHQLRRRWESRLHPYLFFNDDTRTGLRTTMSFVHFNIVRNKDTNTCDLCHPITNEVEEEQIMTSLLYEGLHMNRVSLQQNFDNLSRHDKLTTLCSVFGQGLVFDPDPTYELTTDNVLKMLAIHMRFRCDIPVVIMGETGCGKTRMVEFMSKLKAGPGAEIRNMLTVKVHGGVTVSIIQERVNEAAQLARDNGDVETVLFLDEANTTEAIYAIKEVICDKTVHGRPFHDSGLKIVAACNPYRKHSDEEIQSMENCGLGFNVKTSNTQEKFAGIPMRHLVYRVIPLPPSMQPMVWDFGQLNNETEEIYIRQMVLKLNDDLQRNKRIDEEMLTLMTKTLSASQRYMRDTRDVCRFVSLRDVERTIKAFRWFYKRMENLDPLIDREKDKLTRRHARIGSQLRAFIQALGMCYHTTLNDRVDYRKLVARIFSNHLRVNENDIQSEIVACQSVFMNQVEVGDDIACNEALRENVFMMIICAEMRIPLFLVGKPGSSKSLAKTIVTSAMQGKNSTNPLFKELKQIHVSSFQCSAVSDAVGIEAVFNQCAQIQSQQDLEKFVAVVVLDEIGLAEDSPKMPLKVLHPLLEVGSTKHTGFDVPEYNKVGFVGISNWALDPAKMNRGIFVTRGEPTKLDLQKTAQAFFKSDEGTYGENSHIVKGLTGAYQEVCKMQAEEKEFFGLRDYYGLLKMLFKLASNEGKVEFSKLAICVLRNFGGYHEDVFNVFCTALDPSFRETYRPNVKVIDLVQENLNSDYESRFLLLLTKQYSAVSLLSKVIQRDFQVIFGSSFPRDHDYTEICRNINRIKVCMESGKTVVLLNLRDLYESLYDALNQQYVTFAEQRYVDLGLGGHRVKCRIADNFRLIVIEEKEVVYNEFPIPLINRLEKHVFEIGSVLTEEQQSATERLDTWAKSFANVQINFHRFDVSDAFVGFQEDTAASVVLTVSGRSDENVLEDAKFVLLQTASLDSVVRLSKSKLEDVDQVQQIYTGNQSHETLQKMLAAELVYDTERTSCVKVFEVVSFSMCLNEQDRLRLETELELQKHRIMLVTLQQLQTEEEYIGTLDEFFTFAGSEERGDQEPVILLIQCPQAQQHANLIACAKYTAMNKVKDFAFHRCRAQVIVAFLFSLERSTAAKSLSFTTYHSDECLSVYVDELRPGRNRIAQVGVLWNLSISETLETSLRACRDNNPDLPVDILHLIKIAIPDAMACLTNQHEKDLSRNRVKILNQLCFDWELSRQFVDALMAIVVGLMKDRERGSASSWIVKEACSRTSLQEGGSFRNTLWLRLKQLVSVALARIVSMADCDKNIDVLCHVTPQNAHVVDLWFAIFSSYLCRPQWSNSLTGNYFVVSSQKGYTCQFPFSRAVAEELRITWTVVHQLKGDNPQTAFLNKIKSSPLKQLLANATETKGKDVIDRFTHDLIHLLYKAGSDDPDRERNVVGETIGILFAKQREVEQEHYEIPLLELFTLVMKLRKDLELFAEVVASYSGSLQFSNSWLEDQKRKRVFSLHVSAFRSIVQHLRDGANEIDKVENCNRWKELVCRLKKVAESVLNDADVELATTWNLIRFVELFLDQLVPVNTTHASEYLKTLAPLARRLWKGASKINSLADVKFLNIITKSLKGCTKDVHLKILCSWRETKCRSCRTEKANEPVRLPCGHIICYRCVTLDEEGRNCPACRRVIPDVQALAPVELTKQDKKELETFKSSCTGFFLEYLSTFCFPDPDSASQHKNLPPPDDKILLALEKLVICDKRTQKISPHLSSYDTNPTARSYILQLLMRCDKHAVKEQLNEHFDNMAEVMDDRGVLMDIYLQCSEDMLVNRSQIAQVGDQLNTEFAHDLLHTVRRMIKSQLNTQVEQLDACSMLLYVSRVAAEGIHMLLAEQIKNLKYKRDLQMLVDEVCTFTRDRHVMKQFMVKYMCRRYGIDSFDLLLNDKMYKLNLLPQNLVPHEDDDNPNLYLQFDNFVLSGPTYVRVKDLLFDVVDNTSFPGLKQQLITEIQQGPDSVFQIMLALSTWAARGMATAELRNEVYGFVCNNIHMHLVGGNTQQLYNSVRNRELDLFRVQGVTEQMQYKLTDFITLAFLTLNTSTDRLVAQLQSVLTDPSFYGRKFLPTMPASNFFLVKNVMQQDRTYNNQPPKAYLCPNGHVYFIGECTNPNQAGRCPDCGMNIGGQRHGLLHHGNTAGELTEESQAGYLLKAPEQRGEVAPDRAMTKLSVCAIRACLHAALLLAIRKDEVSVARVVKVQGGHAQLVQFLMGHLVKDMKQLAGCIGKSLDDAIVIMHRILHDMRKSNAQMNDGQCTFDTMANREKWEEAFQRRFLSLVFRDTDAVLNESRQVILDAGKFAEKPLHRLVYEINQPQQPEGEIVEWKNPALWKYRNHIDLQHLKLRLEAVDENARGDGAVLKVMLNMEDLSLIQHIATILEVQAGFIAKYRNKVDINEADKITLEDFLGESDQFFIDELRSYIEIWNKVRMRLIKADRYNTERKYFYREMAMESPISMCLPSDQRRGCCALVLVEYLVELQNELLYKCRELVVPTPEFQQVDADDVSRKHLVCIDQRRDLLPLILANSQYEATVVGGRPQHTITYNLPLLQRKVVENFVLRKCIIKKETIPRMSYPQDVGLRKDCEIVQERFNQVPLPVRLTQAVDGAAHNARKADICEAVRYVTLIIQFLAKLGGSEEQTVCEYAEKELTLQPDETGLIPRSAKIIHCLSLYERLSWHRALLSIKIGQDPFELVRSSPDDMPEELEEKVSQVVQQLNIEKLQFELNSLMMVGPELQEDWSIADALYEYVDGRNENTDNNWCYEIPQEVLVKHSRQLFEISMRFMA